MCWVSLLLAVMVDCHWEMSNNSLLGFSITFIPSVKRRFSVLKACLIWDFLFLMYSERFFGKNEKSDKNQNCKSGRSEMRHKLKKNLSVRSDKFGFSALGGGSSSPQECEDAPAAGRSCAKSSCSLKITHKQGCSSNNPQEEWGLGEALV